MKKQASTQSATQNMTTISNYTLDYCLKLIRLGIKKSGVLSKNPFWEESDLLSAGYLALASAIASYNAAQALSASVLIGVTTLFICLAGIRIGRYFGMRLAGRASVLGGVILIAIGCKILFGGGF